MGKKYRVEAVPWDDPRAKNLRQIRTRVFVREHRVPEQIEIDEIDPIAFHVLAYDEAGNPAATGRLFEDAESPGTGRIGRMAVQATHRGKGFGSAVLEALLEEGLRRGYERFALDSQVHAIPFYEKWGFRPYGEEHYDAGILHRMMEMPAAQAKTILHK